MRQYFCSLIFLLALSAAVNAQSSWHNHRLGSLSKSNDELAKLIGSWTGESLCAGDRPACHDEKVIYRIARSPNAADTVLITMDKIVDGKPETMGGLEFKYDPQQGTLVNEFTRRTTHGRWEFTVKGDTIAGVLRLLPEKTVVRRVQVKRMREVANVSAVDVVRQGPDRFDPARLTGGVVRMP